MSGVLQDRYCPGASFPGGSAKDEWLLGNNDYGNQASVFELACLSLLLRERSPYLLEDLTQVVWHKGITFRSQLLKFWKTKTLEMLIHFTTHQCLLVGHFLPDAFDTAKRLDEGCHRIQVSIVHGTSVFVIVAVPACGSMDGGQHLAKLR